MLPAGSQVATSVPCSHAEYPVMFFLTITLGRSVVVGYGLNVPQGSPCGSPTILAGTSISL